MFPYQPKEETQTELVHPQYSLRQTIGAISQLYYIIIHFMLALSISLIDIKKRPNTRAQDLDSPCRSAFFKIEWRHQRALTYP